MRISIIQVMDDHLVLKQPWWLGVPAWLWKCLYSNIFMAGYVQVQLRHVRFGGELKVWFGMVGHQDPFFLNGDMGHEDVRICKDVLMDVTSHISSMECIGLPGLVLTWLWDQWGMRRREWQCSVDKWGFPGKLCSLGQSLLQTRLVRSDEWIQFGFNVMICFSAPNFR